MANNADRMRDVGLFEYLFLPFYIFFFFGGGGIEHNITKHSASVFILIIQLSPCILHFNSTGQSSI